MAKLRLKLRKALPMKIVSRGGRAVGDRGWGCTAGNGGWIAWRDKCWVAVIVRKEDSIAWAHAVVWPREVGPSRRRIAWTYPVRGQTAPTPGFTDIGNNASTMLLYQATPSLLNLS